MTAKVKPLCPGDLVRAKRNVGVALWRKYEISIDGNCKIRGRLNDRCSKDMSVFELAMVISIHDDLKVQSDNLVALIYMPEKQVFCYTWTWYLMAVA